MSPVLLMVVVSCLALQAAADYGVQVGGIRSNIKEIIVTHGKGGSITLTFTNDRNGSTFRADVFERSEVDKGTILGKVCEADDATAGGAIAKVIFKALNVEGCPFRAGDYPITRKFSIEGHALDEILPPGFGSASILIKVFPPNTDPDGKESIYLFITVTEQ